ncbi:MAG: hypothetical protein ACI8PY_000190, partial [Oceanospirillaceae bacterium]
FIMVKIETIYKNFVVLLQIVFINKDYF